MTAPARTEKSPSIGVFSMCCGYFSLTVPPHTLAGNATAGWRVELTPLKVVNHAVTFRPRCVRARQRNFLDSPIFKPACPAREAGRHSGPVWPLEITRTHPKRLDAWKTEMPPTAAHDGRPNARNWQRETRHPKAFFKADLERRRGAGFPRIASGRSKGSFSPGGGERLAVSSHRPVQLVPTCGRLDLFGAPGVDFRGE